MSILFLMAGEAGSAQTAIVRHAPAIEGRIEGSVQLLSASDTTLGAGAGVTESLLVPGRPTVKLRHGAFLGAREEGTGSAVYAPYAIVLNPGAFLGRLRAQMDPVPFPSGAGPNLLLDGPEGPDVTIDGDHGDSPLAPGRYHRLVMRRRGILTLGVAGGKTEYLFDRLVLEGPSRIRLAGPVALQLREGLVLDESQIGESEHPGWLELRIAGGDLLLNAGSRVYGDAVVPAGRIEIHRDAELVGGVAADDLAVRNGGTLRLVAPNHPPQVALELAPEPGRRVAPARVSAIVTASDEDGRIERVELLRDGAPVLTVREPSLPPDRFMVADVLATPGMHSLRARAVDDDGAATESDPVMLEVWATIPFAANFEAEEGYTPGPLDGQLGWTSSGGRADVGGVAFEGTQGVTRAADARVQQTLVRTEDSPDVIFSDLFVRPVAGEVEGTEGDIIEFGEARLHFVREGTGARVEVGKFDPEGGMGWHPVGLALPVDDSGAASNWARVTFRLALKPERWDLWIDNRLVAIDLPGDEGDPAPDAVNLALSGGSALRDSAFDSFYAGRENPLYADADRDGMEDDWEARNGTDVQSDDREEDLDHDGLSNLEEYRIGTRADSADTDGDALPDGWEIAQGLDPLRAGLPDADANADGLTDLEEFLLGTAPRVTDTDGDGLPDLWEAEHYLDPSRLGDAEEDPDGDGLVNREEFAGGTDPRDFFNGVEPILEPLDEEEGELALQIHRPDGNPWPNAPARFQVTAGSRRIAAKDGAELFGYVVDVRADAEGVARAYLEAIQP